MREPSLDIFTDIHCHLLPGMDDGADSWEESLAMARMAAADGIGAVIATPHQLGSYAHIDAASIRQRTHELRTLLAQHEIPLEVLPGADVRIDRELAARIRCGEVLTLGDRWQHVLLELPHELYFPLEPVIEQLHAHGIVGILSHPERNQGLLKDPTVLERLVDAGCLMQITAGSLLGAFGPHCQDLAEEMVVRRQVHFLATDAHGSRSRRPLLQRAFQRAAELSDVECARTWCCTNPARVTKGLAVVAPPQVRPRRGITHWLGRRRAA